MNKNIALETLKVLAIEAIDEAKSGHPGIALGAASIIYTLYTRHLVTNNEEPNWLARDRFVLSAGHGSSLLYANLHLAGFKISMADLQAFRQLNSLTPGHPEVHLSPGVDATSGPLGQGIAQAVGLALAESHLNARFPDLIDNYTYVLCGDGDLQEGVAQEALSLAGHLKLSKLIILFDSNDIQLDGPVSDSYSDNIALKMKSMNWHYVKVDDGNNIEAIDQAITRAKKANKPSFIEIKTTIGLGATNAGTASVHGSPLKKEEVLAMRATLGGMRFSASQEAYLAYQPIQKKNTLRYQKWLKKAYNNFDFIDFFAYKNIDVLNLIPPYEKGFKQASRATSGRIMKDLTLLHPQLIGGSADLSSSTQISGSDGNFSHQNRLGRNIKFGVREHAMAAVCNGLALFGGLKPYCSGFFVFSDYLKPALRLSALMELNVFYIFTHDSIAVGEDGPTHQPIEQLTMLRSIPNLVTIRPADANEVRFAYQYCLNTYDKPTALILSRQDLETFIPHDKINLDKGAYAINDISSPDGLIIASGSELKLAYDAAMILNGEGFKIRVISIPSTNLYEKQSAEYKENLMPCQVTKRLAVEMSEAIHLWRYVGLKGEVIGLSTFGKSAKGNILTAERGFTVEEIVKRYKALK